MADDGHAGKLAEHRHQPVTDKGGVIGHQDLEQTWFCFHHASR